MLQIRLLPPALAAFITTFLLALSPAFAQLNFDFNQKLSSGVGSPKVKLDAQFTLPRGEEPGILSITAKIPAGHYIYSLTQQGPPQKTVIKLTKSDQYELQGGFLTVEQPKYDFTDIYKGVRIEKFHESVTFYAPLKLADGVQPEELVIEGQLDFQICTKKSCELGEAAFAARLSEKSVVPPVAQPSESDSPAKVAEAEGVAEYRKLNSAVVLKAELVPSQIKPGGKAELRITAHPDSGWHVYAFASKPNPDAVGAGMPTLIVMQEASGFTTYRATTDAEITEKKTPLGDISKYHTGPVTWTVEIEAPADAPAGNYPLSGLVGYQVCTDNSCQAPVAVEFKTSLKVGGEVNENPSAVTFTPAEYDVAAKAAPNYQPLMAAGALPPFEFAGLLWILPLAFAGGLILNLMPCVLPVLGLKVFSIVEQAGHNKREAMQTNLVFTAGVLSVFLVLATLAVVLEQAWGQQFQSPTFNIVLTVILFVFALSFLGVWEIPLPGFVGSSTASDAANREGYAGSFFKGVLSTVLATPCSGPLLGGIFGATLKMPPPVTYLIFIMVGLGMASPYLVVAAFPATVRWLPKPGAWMDTFKQVTGFVMLAAVVVLCKFFIKPVENVVPVLGLLIGCWFGCWWIGRTPLYEPRFKLIKAWALGLAFAVVFGFGGYTLLQPREHVLPWEPFSQSRLAELKAQGKTVMVEFTADWCPTCQVNMVTAIDTETVRQTLEAKGIVPMLADWSDKSDEIKRAINSLDSNSIPLLAIYPADRPDEPIILRDLITKGQLLQAIEEAGGSKGIQQAKTKDHSANPGDSAVKWRPFSSERVEELRAEGKNVLVLYSADWELESKANEEILGKRSPRLAQAVERGDVVPLFADFTDRPDVLRAELQKFDVTSLPLAVIYSSDITQPPSVLREIITEEQVLAAIGQSDSQSVNAEAMATAAMR